MRRIAARNNREHGQTLILFVLALAVLCGLAALAIDIGMLFHERRSLQNAADAAALAAAQELPGTPYTVSATAREWAAKNGYVEEAILNDDGGSGGGGTTVTVNTPYNGDPGRVEVVIRKDVPALFARVLGMSAFPAQARAVATRGSAQARGIGILALDPTACAAFEKSGSSQLQVTNGGAIAVNSNCATAMKFGGSGPVTAGAIYYYSAGGWSQSAGGQISPEPQPMADPVPDPLIGVPPPDLTVLPQSPDSGGTAALPSQRDVTSGDTVLRPGIYYGGLDISSSANVTFEPGIYVMAGGGFELSGSGTITGAGIFIYNTSNPQNSTGDGACASIGLRGSADFNLSAPISGRYANILFWQDIACTARFEHNGNADITAGVIYLPGAEMQLRGTADLGAKQIIADTIDVSGNADVTVNFESYLSGLYGAVRLVE